MALPGECTITIGRLGIFTFPAGYYLYLGSAHSGLWPRLQRHLRREKKLRWHIDYLRRQAQVIEVWYLVSAEPVECLWAQAAATMLGAWIPVPGFGSSDCRCRSHLIHYAERPGFELFQERPGLAAERVTEMSKLASGSRYPSPLGATKVCTSASPAHTCRREPEYILPAPHSDCAETPNRRPTLAARCLR